MKNFLLFLIGALILVGCNSTSTQIPSNTPVTHSTKPLSTSVTKTPTITFTSTAVVETTKCTFNNGFLILSEGEEEFADYFGWTSTGEYYIGVDFSEKLVFCFLKEGFEGTIKEFDRQTDYYAEDISSQVLDIVMQEEPFQIFPVPESKQFIYIKSAEPPIVKNLNKYDIWLWDVEKQESSIILDADDDFWRKCRGFIPPEKMIWLDDNIFFVNCATGDDPNYFFVDIQQKKYEHVTDGECYWNDVFRGYTFSPDGTKHLSLNMEGDMWGLDFHSLLLSETREVMEYYQSCSKAMDRNKGLNNFVQQTTHLPILVRGIEFLNYTHSPVRWSPDSEYLYYVNIDSEDNSYGDIQKYHLSNRTTETLVEFKNLKEYFPEIDEYTYSFDVSPSEEYVLIVFPWDNLTLLRLENLR